MSQTKVKSGLLNFPDQTDFVKLPSGTTAQRPSSPEEGYSRYNTTDDKLEYWNGTVWKQLPELDPPTLTSVDYPGNDLAADTAGGQTILINGTNFLAGISVEIGSTQVSSVTLNSTTQLAITSPALTAGDYDVTVTNLNATTITALDFISYNGVPSWVTASGSLGSLSFGEAISTISLSATEPDGGSVSYAVTSGALPSGLSLSSSGDITGTMPAGSAETTYTFTVTATDDENQSTDRSFSITGVVPFLPSQHFNTVTYTGNGGTQSITGVGFQPDFTWIKVRNYPAGHNITDSVRGPYKVLSGLDTQAEIDRTSYAGIASFDIDGFTVKDSSLGDYAFNGPPGGNYSGNGTYVSWNFKAGGAAVSNTDGTITSQVSANTAAGFSIVSYTGNGANGTVGHGLGAIPNIVLSKRRTGGTSAWSFNGNVGGLVYGSNKLTLETTSAIVADTNEILAANSNNFTAGTSTGTGASGSTYIAYCFAEVEGFSKFGSYVGNGSTQSIATGFKPAFVILKRTNGVSHWVMADNKRTDGELLANVSDAERIENTPDFLSNGFNFTTERYNSIGEEWIYMAFAADPNTQVPTKADSFNTVLHTPNNSGNDISLTGVNFAPDFVWMKYRYSTPATGQHYLFNSVTGDSILKSNANQAEISGGYIKSFDADGVTYLDTLINRTGTDSTVAWCWKAGGTPYINTDGSITSVVSANPAAGFSIVSFTSTTGSWTVGHGLSSAPKMVIYKNRDIGNAWAVWVDGFTDRDTLYLNLTNEKTTGNVTLHGSIPTSTTIGCSSWLANPGDRVIAYCFAEVPGFSKIGSYTGNRGTNFITTGFEPAFIMMKSSSTATNGYWVIMDNKRSPSNPRDNELFPNDSVAEYEGNRNINFLSNGFELTSSSYNNDNGTTYIYMAFANQF